MRLCLILDYKGNALTVAKLNMIFKVGFFFVSILLHIKEIAFYSRFVEFFKS